MPAHIYRRKAKGGLVKADGQLFLIKRNGLNYTGPLTLNINNSKPVAYIELSKIKAEFLQIEFIEKLKETKLPRLHKALMKEVARSAQGGVNEVRYDKR